METWYILVTRHFDGGRDEKKLHVGEWAGAQECDNREHALEVIGRIKQRPCQLAQGERSEPTYEPIPASALDTIFPNRKSG